jgi:hypothetical protein
MLEFVRAQDLLPVHESRIRTPQHEAADDIREARAFDAKSFLLKQLGSLVVGREEYFERRAVLDLGVKLPARAGTLLNLMACRFLEFRAYFLERRNKIGGHGNLDLFGRGRRSRNKQ